MIYPKDIQLMKKIPPQYFRKPEWIRMAQPQQENLQQLKHNLNIKKLNTVCQEAKCPNINECWSQGTATIMILGDTCTRGCKFCNIKTGNPRGVVDGEEPLRVAEQISESNLRYVVITCVDRDDLADGGASVFAETIIRVKSRTPDIKIETLIGDFQGISEPLRVLVESGPDVVAHNVETVEALTPMVRDRRATYRNSLKVLKEVKTIDPKRLTKSSIMVGLGETMDELKATCMDLREQGVDIITFGQYLRPTMKHLSVKRYYHPDEFKALEEMSRAIGFLYVASGPLVRSSYRAAELFINKYLREREEVTT